MKKMNYERPLAEVIELTADDIVTASVPLLTQIGDGTSGISAGSSSYDDWFNKSAGGRITLN